MAITLSTKKVKTIIVNLTSKDLETVKEGLYYDVLFDYEFKRPHIVSIHELLEKIDEDTPGEVEDLVRTLFGLYGDSYIAFADKDYNI